MPHVFYDSTEVYDRHMMETRPILRSIKEQFSEAQIVQKLKNNEPRAEF